ncbi:excalibur calcium-binding domain-containing protein [Actinomycetes bacterium NPDC127524]
MKKLSVILLSLGLVLGFSFSTGDNAKASTKIITYKNCTALNKVYKGGVAKSSKVRNKGGKTHYKPYVSSALYSKNIHSDRDKDGIACER